MSQQRALPQKIAAGSLRSAAASGGARTNPTPLSRAPRAIAGVLLAAGLVGLSPASAEPDTTPVAPAPNAPMAVSGSPVSLPAIPQNLDQVAIDPQVIRAATSYIPALIGAVSEPGVRDTDQTQQLLSQMQGVLGQAHLPSEYQGAMVRATSMLRNQEPGAVPAAPAPSPGQDVAPGSPSLPGGDDAAPRIQEFMLPTIGMNCIQGSDGDGNAMGKALVAAGPQEAPAPGPKEGEAGYVFTALGTGAAVADDAHPLSVNWFNLDTGAKGQARLLPNPAINATTGPATFTAIIPTGKGRVLSTVFGTVTSKAADGEDRSCSITPTVGMSKI
ncbi:conserved hypothetical protein [Segniliparus rotundus DSM 44985]|uniref:Uncharacterized protein n=1 Tax=Segniliparus rotundus (strain ATCC BAA-972 / CDC 1076 / CIP 108378 / DSM 44985 / JCM 13578) TaxID=640132 RepID=D6ZE30_SEGRD|nr:hypothetical protein [Segniliparus rotundus]ADG97310.1 conserved hypothetical protein [Segniliparus rotundus DSM 44985]